MNKVTYKVEFFSDKSDDYFEDLYNDILTVVEKYAIKDTIESGGSNGPASIFDLKLLPFGVRVILNRNGIYTVDRLCSYNEKMLLKLEGLGKAGIRKIKEALEFIGLSLKED